MPPVIMPSSCWERGRIKKTERKLVVILKSPLDAGLIIVCLVFGIAVIETLAVRVYIQHVGGLCAPRGLTLITSLDHKPKQLVYTSLPIFFCSLVLSSSFFGVFFFRVAFTKQARV